MKQGKHGAGGVHGGQIVLSGFQKKAAPKLESNSVYFRSSTAGSQGSLVVRYENTSGLHRGQNDPNRQSPKTESSKNRTGNNC